MRPFLNPEIRKQPKRVRTEVVDARYRVSRGAGAIAGATGVFTDVFDEIIRLIPDAAWARTGEMIERFKLTGL